MNLPEHLVPFTPFLGHEDLLLVVKTWHAGGLNDADWENVIRHQVAVAALGHAIASFQESTWYSPREVVLACLIHDAFKRREVEARKASDGDPAVLDAMAKKQEEFLAHLGWDYKIIHATASVGHTSLNRFYNLFGDILGLDEVVHLADSLTDNDQYPMLEVRMASLRQRYPKLQAEDPKRYGLPQGRTIFGVQEEIAFRLLAKFGDHANMQPRAFHEECARRANSFLGR